MYRKTTIIEPLESSFVNRPKPCVYLTHRILPGFRENYYVYKNTFFPSTKQLHEISGDDFVVPDLRKVDMLRETFVLM